MKKKSIQSDPGGRGQKKQPVDKKRVRAPRPVQTVGQPVFPFDDLHEALVVLNAHGRIRSMNRAARDLLGEAADSLPLEDWPATFGLYAPDGASPLPSDNLPPRRALQGERVDPQEMLLRRNGDSRGRWISMAARPLADEQGRVDGALALLQDIHEYKRAALARERYGRRIETFYRLTRLIAACGDDAGRIAREVARLTSEVLGDLSVVTLLNAKGEKVHIAGYADSNPEARAAFGELLKTTDEFTRDQGLVAEVIRSGKPALLPSVPMDHLLANSVPVFADFIRTFGVNSILIVPMVGRSGVIGTINLSRHRGGHPYNLPDQTFLMEIANRTAQAIETCTLVDSLRQEIAERLSTAQALDVSEERFRSIFESTNLGIKVLDSIGTILQTNPAFQQMMGYRESDLVGKSFYDFLHPGDLERALQFFNDLKISGVPESHFEHRTIGSDGTVIWVKTTFAAIRRGGDDSPSFVVGILENVTRQKQLEKERLELKSRLQSNMELERLRLARELHDGPMQELYSAIYRLKELRMKGDPEIAQTLDTVNQDIQKVLQELRVTAKELRPPTISSFGLEKAIRSYAEDFRETYPHIHLHLSLAQDRQLLPEDVRLTLYRILQQALMNVAQHAHATEVHVRFAFDAEEARLEITDNGRGFKVPATWLTLVRDGHYGLAGSAERVDALGGVFTVDSTPKSSTIIHAVIPWTDSPADGDDPNQDPILRRAKDLI